MSEKHTPGRVKVQHPHAGERGWEVAFEPGLEQLCQNITEENARRLVACWNACEMASTEDLEALTHPADVSWAYTIDRLVRERDELLEALKRIVDWDDVGLALTQDHVVQARAAIAKVKGGAA